MDLRDLNERAAELALNPRFMAISQADFDRLCEKHPFSVCNVTRGCLEPVKAISVGFNWFAVPGEMPQQETTT